MSTETLQINLAQKIFNIWNENLLQKINNLINSDNIVGYELDGTPITVDQFVKEMDIAIDEHMKRKINLVEYILALPYENRIATVKVTSPTTAIGDSVINPNGAFRFFINSTLTLAEGDFGDDFCYKSAVIQLNKTTDEYNNVIHTTEEERAILEKVLSIRLVFDIQLQ